MTDRSITIRGIPNAVLVRLRARAARQHRSLNGEVLSILAGAADQGVDAARTGAVHETPAAYHRNDPAADGSAARTAPHDSPLDALDREALTRLCRQYHIQFLAVFGSHARGEAGPDSDVDVVVDFEAGMTPGLGIIRVADALRAVFGGRRVDLVTRRGLNPRLRDRIMSEARVLHAA